MADMDLESASLARRAIVSARLAESPDQSSVNVLLTGLACEDAGDLPGRNL
jgi:hypothetical protein